MRFMLKFRVGFGIEGLGCRILKFRASSLGS